MNNIELTKRHYAGQANNIKPVNISQQQTSTDPNRIIYVGKVISIDDNQETMRIKVKIPELDNLTSDEDLPYCYALQSQIVRIFPKVDESVLVIVSDINKNKNDRIWVAPIIITHEDIEKSTFFKSNVSIGIEKFYEKRIPSITPINYNGILPNKEDVAFVGRKNTDVTLGDNKLILRCNYKNDDLTLNTKNPAYIELHCNKETKKTTNIVRADNVLLISHDGFPNFKTIMDDKEIENAIKKCHSLPYGDLLVDVLKLFAQAIVNHYHPYPTNPPIKEDYIISIRDFNFDSILSKNIKIN